MKKKNVFPMEQRGKISEMNRSFDIEYWQKLGSAAIFSAAWDLVTEYYNHRKLDVSKLRLQRSVENFGRL